MMIVQYLLDADERSRSRVSPSRRPSSPTSSRRCGLRSSRRSASPSRSPTSPSSPASEGDLVGEQFLHWFLQEQREEVSSMGALLTVVERSRDNVMLIEDFLAREAVGDDGDDRRARRRRVARSKRLLIRAPAGVGSPPHTSTCPRRQGKEALVTHPSGRAKRRADDRGAGGGDARAPGLARGGDGRRSRALLGCGVGQLRRLRRSPSTLRRPSPGSSGSGPTRTGRRSASRTPSRTATCSRTGRPRSGSCSAATASSTRSKRRS